MDKPRTAIKNIVSAIESAAARPLAVPLLIVALGLWLLTCQWLRHFAFETSAYDLRIHEELVRSVFNGTPFYSGLLGQSFLGYHVSIIFALLAPLYALCPTPTFLLILQGVLVMLGAWFLWRIAHHAGLRPMVSLALVCAFFFFRGMHESYFRGFQQEVLGMVFLLGFLWAHQSRRRTWGIILGLLALSCREDVAVFMLPLGLAACLSKKDRGWGLGVCATCLAWISICYFRIIPAHTTGGMAGFDRWTQYGDTVPAIAAYWLRHPAEILSHIFNLKAIRLFLFLLCLPLVDPLALCAMAIPWIVNTTSSFPHQSQLGGAYGALFVPFLFLGAIRVLSRPKLRAALASHTAALVFFVVLIAINFRLPPLPESLQGAMAANAGMARLNHHLEGRRVLAQGCVIPHLGWPAAYDMLGSPQAREDSTYDVIVLAPGKNAWPLQPEDIRARIQALSASGDWAHQEDGFVHIFRKVKNTR